MDKKKESCCRVGAGFSYVSRSRLLEVFNGFVRGAVELAEELVDDREELLAELHEDRHDHRENENVLGRGLSRLVTEKLI